ncbi:MULTISPECIES: PRC-barrel domain-containing protein [Rhizobium]|uniref:PRC-barrel domain containing protein n=1 Tax=Rhizobium tropici TaxID=398 RepID=A0A329YFG4_RHITR|nr:MULTISPECIES: PRC-barrel domain-containing protein [Rhizobium]MBB3288601.1 sporulation protein YlmC with PRC-barrel domain [Rhizobium sp. BK252]MBB3403262.1 sporulation protein YlmC with PRC-barrel domain [Rhizobium sp. BK289]MBB3415837.1 sporulation protein YlmC with PRC-barrel domain [Rhizobium sp. BK284]MBB3483725.1 sporulation protein YlmC with PRC-barrel domain [Rhizobium sp. BK347]MDK4722296.1 PRC-barrel domain-containing protein [Rhizobium sp. CNPSo 3968]
MTGKLFTSVAAGAIFATASVLSPMAYAQAQQPSNGGTGNAPVTQSAPATPDAAKPDSSTPETKAQAPAPTGTQQASGYLTTQSADQISAKTYMGQSVYNGQNESIGSINDLILQKQGGVVAAIVGVGGFLGIGQKNVAVPFDKINATQNPQDGTVKLTTTETADSLKAAPEFKTLAMQASDKAASSAGTSTMPATDNTTTSSTTNK